MLTEKQTKHVCLAGMGATQCRYLEQDPKDWRKFHCVKLLSAVKKQKDHEVRTHLALCKQNNVDPFTQYVPIGDGAGCTGFVQLKHVKQGYDVRN